jgi:hypothetical protein
MNFYQDFTSMYTKNQFITSSVKAKDYLAIGIYKGNRPGSITKFPEVSIVTMADIKKFTDQPLKDVLVVGNVTGGTNIFHSAGDNAVFTTSSKILMGEPDTPSNNTTGNLELFWLNKGTILNNKGDLVISNTDESANINFALRPYGVSSVLDFYTINGTSGANVFHKNVNLKDSVKLALGDGSDMIMMHSGTSGSIDNVTGVLKIFSADKLQLMSSTQIDIGDGTNILYTLPLADGTAGQVIKTDGSGVLSFQNDLDVQNIFQKIAVSGQTTIEADATNDTVTFDAGTGITLTTNATTDTLSVTVNEDELPVTAGMSSTINYYGIAANSNQYDIKVYITNKTSGSPNENDTTVGPQSIFFKRQNSAKTNQGGTPWNLFGNSYSPSLDPGYDAGFGLGSSTSAIRVMLEESVKDVMTRAGNAGSMETSWQISTFDIAQLKSFRMPLRMRVDGNGSSPGNGTLGLQLIKSSNSAPSAADSTILPSTVYVYFRDTTLETSKMGGPEFNLLWAGADTTFAKFQNSGAAYTAGCDYVFSGNSGDISRKYELFFQDEMESFGRFSNLKVTDGRVVFQDLPTTDPDSKGIVWNNSGALNVSGYGSGAGVDNPLEEVVVNSGVASLSKSVTIPSGATSILEKGFQSKGLTAVTFSEGLVTINPRAFDGNMLSSVSLPSTLAGVIGERAFASNNIVGSIAIPSGVTKIDDQCFNNQQNNDVAGITALTFTGTSSLTTIGQSAFQFNRITSLAFPSSLTLIKDSAFAGTGISGTETLTSLTFASAITIQIRAFADLFGGTTLTIPNNSVIQGFERSPNLTTINLGTGVTLGNEVFQQCSSLVTVTLPTGTVLPNGSQFRLCTSLTTVNIPNTITAIPENFLSNCTSFTGGTNLLSSGTFASQITEFKSGCFTNCTSLPATVNFPTVCSIATNTFNGTNITTANIKTGSTVSMTSSFPAGTQINFT